MAKTDLHDLSEELPTNWENILDVAQRCHEAHAMLMAAPPGAYWNLLGLELCHQFQSRRGSDDFGNHQKKPSLLSL